MTVIGFTSCGAEEAGALTKDQAISIAFEEVQGAGTSDVTRAEKDISDGIDVFDITIVCDGREYEYTFNSDTGDVIEKSVEGIDR